jgi:hypothetical protein
MKNYFDFPRCREAFALGQKDARPVTFGSCYYRLRGRTRSHFTLLSFDSPLEAWEQLGHLKAKGARVQGVNFTSPQPPLPVAKGPTEWISTDFPKQFEEATGRHGKRLRRLHRQVSIGIPSKEEALHVFKQWEAWAKGRHFMVFKGHYLKWIEMFYENPGNCHLISVFTGGKIEGIFGWEETDDLCQVTIAKHSAALEGKALWVAGLLTIGSRKVLCGSTADKLKKELGLERIESWVFDLSRLQKEKPDGPRSLVSRRAGV